MLQCGWHFKCFEEECQCRKLCALERGREGEREGNIKVGTEGEREGSRGEERKKRGLLEGILLLPQSSHLPVRSVQWQTSINTEEQERDQVRLQGQTQFQEAE